MNEPATAREAIDAAGLNYLAELKAIQTDDGIPIPQRKAVIRSDSKDVLGVVGNSYVPVQNQQAFEFLDAVVLDENLRFGRWLRRYAVFLHQPENLPLLVSQQLVKQFCRTLLVREVPAWQRLQAVQAIEFYRNEVLATAEPDLLEIRQILSRTADGERHSVHVVTRMRRLN